MKKLFGFVAAGVFAMSVSACGLGDVVDDINDAIADAATQAKVEKAFESAVTEVTLEVVGVALEAASGDMTSETAPAFAALAELETIDIDTSVTTEDGATVTVKGTISGTVNDEDAAITIDLESTWSGLKVELSDGSTVTTTGSQSIDGTITVEGEKISIAFTTKGSMTIDGKSYTFDIVMTADSESNTLTYTGTINGFPVSKTINLPADEEDVEEEAEFAQCLRDAGDLCISYSTAEFACEDLTDATYTAVNNCETEDTWYATCTIADHSVQYFGFDDSANCAMKGGVWAEL